MRSFCILLSLTTLSLAQSQPSHFIKRAAFETGLVFQSWSSGSAQTLDEIVVPLLLHYPFSERFSISVLNTPTRASLRNGNVSSRLTAFTDTRISTAVILGEERVLLNFGASAPSGRTALKPNEILAAQQITSHALAMPTSYFGGGVELSASLAAATEVGAWVLGGSFGGIYKGSFTPTLGATKYLPGPEISASLGFDRPLGEQHRLFGDLGYTWYAADKLAGVKVFQADGKINFSLGGVFTAEKWRISLLAENRLKRQSPFALNNSFSVSYGNEFNFATELAREINHEAAWLASTDLRLHSKNNNGANDAIVFSIGPGWRGMLLPALQMEAATHFAIGKLDGNCILGGEARVGFIYQF